MKQPNSRRKRPVPHGSTSWRGPEELEKRLLLSASPLDGELPGDTETLDPVASVVELWEDPATEDSTAAVEDSRRELVFIDPTVPDHQRLVDAILAQRHDRAIDVVVIDGAADGVEQITGHLRDAQSVDAIHIVSHGSAGVLHLGTTSLSLDTLEDSTEAIAGWREALAEHADVLIYGCDIAADSAGRELVDALAQLTGADVTASTDLTGSAAHGGDWDLEHASGTIETESVLGPGATPTWQGVLASVTVSTTDDVVDGDVSSIAGLIATPGADGLISLREAVIASNATSGADTISLPTGTYTLTGARNENAAATGDLDITDDVTIDGGGMVSAVISGGGIDRIFHVLGGSTLTLRDVTLQDGNPGGSGGGAILTAVGTGLNLERVLLDGNQAGDGGGISTGGTLTATDTQISGNTTTGWGGGIYNDFAVVTLERVTISGNNAAKDGGGIYNFGSGADLTLRNATISGNTAAANGGGIFTSQPVTITNSTIAFNSSTTGGGGVHTNGSGDATLENTILASNTGGNANRALTSLGNNIDSDGTAGLTGPGDQSGVDPELDVLQDNGSGLQTHALLPTSPAIDAGSAAGTPVTDSRGFTRVAGTDIGAFEFAAAALEITVTTENDDVDGDTSSVANLLASRGIDGEISLREAILAANNESSGVVIRLPAGTYRLSLGGTGEDAGATGDLDVTGEITVVGAGAGTTIIDAQGNDRVLEVLTGARLDVLDVTIRNGDAGSGDGGGIRIDFGEASLRRVIVSGSSADAGGGVRVFQGAATLVDTEIRGNSSVSSGGGVSINGGVVDLLRVTVAENLAGVNGGGIENEGNGTSLTLTNATLSGNTSGTNGGGVFTVEPVPMTNVTIANNSAAAGGGGIYLQTGGADAVLKNTILANNTGGNVNRAVTSLGNNIDSDGTAGLTGPGDQSGVDPGLDTLQDNGGPIRTHALLAASPAIDAGSDTGAPVTDSRGFARVAATDIGAFEFAAAALEITVTTPNDVVDGDTSSVANLLASRGVDGEISLREAVIAANNTPGGVTIRLPVGNYQFSIAGTGENAAATGDLDIEDDLTILGGGMASTVIDAGLLDRVFEVRGVVFNLRDLTLGNGDAGSGDGGGILIAGGSTVDIRDTTIRANNADRGGGIHNQGLLTMRDAELAANVATNQGGGIRNRESATFDGVAFAGNSADEGGGIHNSGASSSLALTNVTVSGNTATTRGGGMDTDHPVSITNSTIAFNTAGTVGGIRAHGGNGIVTLQNTILANNTGGNSESALNSIGNNIDTDGTAMLAGPGDQTGANPNLDGLLDNGGPTRTHALLAGSNAIDQGSDVGAPLTDQRGVARVGTTDVGAYEFVPSGNQPPTTTGIADVTVDEDAPDTVIDLFAAFDDAEDADSALIYTVENNTNPALFTATPINGGAGTLTLDYAPNAHGTAAITVRATDTGGLFQETTFTVTANPVADTPSVTNASTSEDTQTSSGLVISRNPADGAEVTHFKITGIANGTLYQNDGTTPINDGDFITFAQGNAGLRFTPSTDFNGNATFDVQASTSNSDPGLGGSVITATISVSGLADTPSVTNASTAEDTQTTSGLVISRNVNDGAEVTHFKITNIANGTLYQNDGTTVIAAGDFITFAEGNAGLKFTPAPSFTGSATFDIQASIANNDSGLGGAVITATISVGSAADTPTVTNSTTSEDTQTTSGLVISRNPADGPEVTHFKITGITNGTLYQNDGTTPINDGDFITFAQGNAGLKFTPALNSTANGSFTVQASTASNDTGLGGSTVNATITVSPVADTPAVTNASTSEDTQTSSGLVISRNAADGAEVTHFKITGITNGTLYQNDGTTPINDGDFITFAQGNAGLRFTPALNSTANGSFTIQASTASNDTGLGGSTVNATITVSPVADTPAVTNASTSEDTQTSSGLVISRNAADGAEVTHFKITGITNGTLYQNDGATPINNGDFITFAQGNAGLKFTPALNSTVDGSFTVQASTAANDAGLGGSTVNATITVSPVADTPSVTNASTSEDTQTSSGLVISRNAADGAEVTHFKITGITNGALYQNDGTTAINNGDFITFAQGNAGLRFTPAPGSTIDGTVTVQASTAPNDGGLGGNTVTATITVNSSNGNPVLAVNSVLQVEELTITPVTNANLLVTDPDNPPADLLFTLTATPAQGILRLGGVALGPGDTFTQDDINQNQLAYESLEEPAGATATPTTDGFSFTLSDGAGGSLGTTVFSIEIDRQPPDTPPPPEPPPEEPPPDDDPVDDPIDDPVDDPTDTGGTDPPPADDDPPPSEDTESPGSLNDTFPDEPLPVPATDSTGTGDIVFAAARALDDANVLYAEASPAVEAETGTTEQAQVRRIEVTDAPAAEFESSEYIFQPPELWRELDELEREMELAQRDRSFFAGAAVFVTMSMTVGYLAWLIRASYILGSLLSSMPAWNFADPLPILDHFDSSLRGRDAGGDRESLESLVSEEGSSSRGRNET